MQKLKLTTVIALILFCFPQISSCGSSNSFDHEKNIKDNLERLRSEPENCLSLEQVAASYSALEQYDNAINYYLKTIKKCPENYHALFQLGTCYYRTGGKNKANEYMIKAISKAEQLGDNKFVELYTEEMNAWLETKPE